MVESLIRVTRVAAKAKVVVAMVKQVVALATGTSESKDVRPSTTQESTPIPSEVHLLGMERCLRLLEDSIPSKVKEEV